MRRLTLAVLAVALVGAAACKRKPEAAPDASPAPLVIPAGFQHDPKFDVDGYYLPSQPIQVGNFKLVNLAMGAESDFAAWETGEREGVFGPIIAAFEDVTSPIRTNEMGQETRKTSSRTLPYSYRMFPGEAAFAAKDSLAGEIKFSGRFDQTVLPKARADRSSETPVLNGTLQIGAQRFEDVKFTYFAGD